MRAGAAGASVRALRGLPVRDPDGCPVELRPAVDPADLRVPEEVLVVAVGVVVGARVGAAALLPLDPAEQHARGELEAAFELERLGQLAVEDVALVLDDDALVALEEPVDDRDLLLHLLLATEDAEVLEHRRAQVLADLPGPLAVAPLEECRELRVG